MRTAREGRDGSAEGRGKGPYRVRSIEARASRNGKRAKGAERRHGWPSGESSGGRYQTPWADVARNKATRSRRAQTAERVKNPESGRCRRGKPTQRSPGLDTPKGTEPHGRSRPYPTLRVLHPRNASAERRWEAAFGRTARNTHGFGRARSEPETREYPGGRARPRSSPSKRESSSRLLRLRSEAPLRGGTESQASARDTVKLVASRSRARRHP
jgi:hypothetical protein